MKINLFKLVIIGIVIDIVFVPLSLVIAQLGFKPAFHFFKIPFLMIFFGTFISLLRNRKLMKITFLIMVIQLFAFFNGVITNGLNIYTISHFYYGLLAISGIQFGKIILERKIKFSPKLFTKFAVFLTFFMIIYYVLYTLGIINYWGISTNIGFLLLFFVYKQDTKKSFLTLFAMILSGKRTPILASLISYLSYKFSFKLKNLATIIFLFFLIFIIIKTGLLDRILNPIILIYENIDSEQAWYVLTGGRNFEVIYALEKFKSVKDYLFGFGYGANYTMPAGLNDMMSSYTQHYTHFSPVSLLLVYGGLITFVLYIIFLYATFKKSNDNESYPYYKLIFIYSLIASFSGATIFVDSKFWILLGVLLASKPFDRSIDKTQNI